MAEETEGVRVEIEADDEGWVVANMYRGRTYEGKIELARVRQSMLSTEQQRERFLELLNTGMVESLKLAGHDDIRVSLYRGSFTDKN